MLQRLQSSTFSRVSTFIYFLNYARTNLIFSSFAEISANFPTQNSDDGDEDTLAPQIQCQMYYLSARATFNGIIVHTESQAGRQTGS